MHILNTEVIPKGVFFTTPDLKDPFEKTPFSEGPKGGRRKGGRGRKLSHFSFCCAFRCCVVYSPCFPLSGVKKKL